VCVCVLFRCGSCTCSVHASHAPPFPRAPVFSVFGCTLSIPNWALQFVKKLAWLNSLRPQFNNSLTALHQCTDSDVSDMLNSTFFPKCTISHAPSLLFLLLLLLPPFLLPIFNSQFQPPSVLTPQLTVNPHLISHLLIIMCLPIRTLNLVESLNFVLQYMIKNFQCLVHFDAHVMHH